MQMCRLVNVADAHKFALTYSPEDRTQKKRNLWPIDGASLRLQNIKRNTISTEAMGQIHTNNIINGDIVHIKYQIYIFKDYKHRFIKYDESYLSIK